MMAGNAWSLMFLDLQPLFAGDYIKPFEDEGNTSHVVVSMNVTHLKEF